MLLLCLGCGGSEAEPPLAPVKGKITVDGVPAAGLQVTFNRVSSDQSGAKDVGGVASAVTDAGGNYQLLYKGTTPGAPVGNHQVRIMRPDADLEAPPGPPIPPNYNVDTSLTADVKAEADNTFDYDVKTK